MNTIGCFLMLKIEYQAGFFRYDSGVKAGRKPVNHNLLGNNTVLALVGVAVEVISLTRKIAVQVAV